MGARAYVVVTENEKKTVLYGQWAANNLTVPYRLAQAMRIREQEKPDESLTDILSHMDYEARYRTQMPLHNHVLGRIKDSDEIAFALAPEWESWGDIDMRIWLDLDNQIISSIQHDEKEPAVISIANAFDYLDRTLIWAKDNNTDDFLEMERQYRKELKAEPVGAQEINTSERAFFYGRQSLENINAGDYTAEEDLEP